MLFNSYLFIFCFLPLVWGIFHALKAYSFHTDSIKVMSLAKAFLVGSSLFFYAYWKLAYLPILLGSLVVNYAFARAILSRIQAANYTGGGGEVKV